MIKEIQKRHKCQNCGAVRYEDKMVKLSREKSNASYHFNNDNKSWACQEDFWCSYKKKLRHK